MTQPVLPPQMRRLRRDAEGFPVPWFVQRDHGQTNYTTIDSGKLERAIAGWRCWICGERLGRRFAFPLPASNTITRLSTEPPSHRECATYAVRVCPFITPMVMAVWVTPNYRVQAGDRRTLCKVGEPVDVVWFHKGRRASRREVSDAIMAEVPGLAVLMSKDGAEALDLLKEDVHRALRWLPDEDDDADGVDHEAASPAGTAVAVTIATK